MSIFPSILPSTHPSTTPPNRSTPSAASPNSSIDSPSRRASRAPTYSSSNTLTSSSVTAASARSNQAQIALDVRRPSSARSPPQGALGGSGRLGASHRGGRGGSYLGAQPLPRVLELAASDGANLHGLCPITRRPPQPAPFRLHRAGTSP